MLGMKDTISEEDLLIDVTRTELEKRLTKTENENELRKEEFKRMKKEVEDIRELAENVRSKLRKLELKEI